MCQGTTGEPQHCLQGGKKQRGPSPQSKGGLGSLEPNPRSTAGLAEGIAEVEDLEMHWGAWLAWPAGLELAPGPGKGTFLPLLVASTCHPMGLCLSPEPPGGLQRATPAPESRLVAAGSTQQWPACSCSILISTFLNHRRGFVCGVSSARFGKQQELIQLGSAG